MSRSVHHSSKHKENRELICSRRKAEVSTVLRANKINHFVPFSAVCPAAPDYVAETLRQICWTNKHTHSHISLIILYKNLTLFEKQNNDVKNTQTMDNNALVDASIQRAMMKSNLTTYFNLQRSNFSLSTSFVSSLLVYTESNQYDIE